MDEEHVRLVVRQELRTVFAAALADPDVGQEAKSLAGYALRYLARDPDEIAADLVPLEPEAEDAGTSS